MYGRIVNLAIVSVPIRGYLISYEKTNVVDFEAPYVSVPIRGYLISYLHIHIMLTVIVSVPIRGYLISYPVSVTLVFMHPDYLLCGAKFIIL